MKKLIHCLIVITLIFTACDDCYIAANLLTGDLEQSWTHSFEEQSDLNSPTRIYRKSDSREFAASRFRDAFEFNVDGTCRYLVLHPADAHYFADGTYTLDTKEKKLSIFDDNGELVKAFRVVQLQETLLILEPVS